MGMWVLEPPNEVTIEAWIKTPSPSNSMVIVDLHQAPNQAPWLSLKNSKVYIDGAGWGGIALYGDTTIKSNKWHHVVGIIKQGVSGYAEIYLDGHLDGEKTGNISWTYTSQPTYIGIRHWAGQKPFNGTIDEVRIYDTALTTAEIQKHYTQGAQAHGIVLNQ